jgi:hypothetical protein
MRRLIDRRSIEECAKMLSSSRRFDGTPAARAVRMGRPIVRRARSSGKPIAMLPVWHHRGARF